MELLKHNLFAVLMTVVLVGSIVYAAGMMYAKFDYIIARQDAQAEQIQRMTSEITTMGNQLTRIEEHLNGDYLSEVLE